LEPCVVCAGQVRLADGVRVGGSRLEGELVDLSGRPASLGVCAHEDLICVLAVRMDGCRQAGGTAPCSWRVPGGGRRGGS
jgi:hypothetical protein